MKDLFEKLKTHPFLIAGPCVIEDETMTLRLAENIAKIALEIGFEFIFKASFDKANRTSIQSFRGPGLAKGLETLQKVKDKFGIPVTTDIHETVQVKSASDVVDVLQIPAFLCRQTDLLLAAGQSGCIVNVKKAQFLSGVEMVHPANKIESTGNQKILFTERGNIIGYGNLVVDFRNIIDMKQFGYPIILDATHSVQQPGGLNDKTGGDRHYAPYLASAAAAVGVRGFFFEVHENPDQALSDGPNMIKLSDLNEVLSELIKVIDCKAFDGRAL